MKLVPLWSVALVALILAGVTVAQGFQPNFIRNLLSPIITGGETVTGQSTFNGDLTVNGDAGVGKNVSIGGTLTTTGAISATAANITTTGKYCTTSACSTNYFQNDTFGKVNVVGPLALNNNLEVLGTTSSTDYFIAATGIKNTGTSAACSGNLGAVCVNDTGGLAIADGSGTTVASVVAGVGTFAGVTLSTGTSLVYAAACDSTGSPGAATCNQGAGRAAIAASAAAVTITNSLSKTTSIIHATLQTTDAVCVGIKSLVPSNGSFVITANAVCTGNTNVAWGFDSP